MPINYSEYAPAWKTEIRPRALERAKNCCEFCGLENKAMGYRGENGEWFSIETVIGNLELDGVDLFAPGMPLARFDMPGKGVAKPTRIVLTIAHLNHDVSDNTDENLKALCQRCHLIYDRELHAKNARLTREKKAGLQRLFE